MLFYEMIQFNIFDSIYSVQFFTIHLDGKCIFVEVWGLNKTSRPET